MQRQNLHSLPGKVVKWHFRCEGAIIIQYVNLKRICSALAFALKYFSTRQVSLQLLRTPSPFTPSPNDNDIGY